MHPRRWVYLLGLGCAVAPFFSIAASQSLLAALLIALLVEREKLRFPPIAVPLSCFIGGTLLSLAVSGHVAAGWPQVRKLALFVLVPLAMATIFRTPEYVRRLIGGWVAAATVAAVYGLVQFAGTFAAAFGSGGDLYHALVSKRITGFMSLWMTFSGQLMIVLLLLLAVLLFEQPKGAIRWLLAGSGVLIALALLLALTRGPWIGTAVGGVYLLWRWKRKAVLAVPVLAVAAFLAAPSALRERVTSIARPHSSRDSHQHRAMLWRTGVEMVKAHPWLGLGPEQVGAQFDAWVPPDIPRPLPWGWRGHLHTVYLQYAAERGLPVLAAFLWLIGKVLWDLRRLHGFTAAILAVLAAGLFEHNLGDSEMLQVFLTLIAAGYGQLTATVPQPRVIVNAPRYEDLHSHGDCVRPQP
jgi:O-antigen ligase